MSAHARAALLFPVVLDLVACGDDGGQTGSAASTSSAVGFQGHGQAPAAGAHTLRATLGVPTFSRHGEHHDTPALSEGVTVTFPDVTPTQG
jgi:hypothetical protein